MSKTVDATQLIHSRPTPEQQPTTLRPTYNNTMAAEMTLDH
jgi:hypothetical protein